MQLLKDTLVVADQLSIQLVSLESNDSQTFPFMDLNTPCALELFVLSRDYFAVLCVEDGVHLMKVFKLNATGSISSP